MPMDQRDLPSPLPLHNTPTISTGSKLRRTDSAEVSRSMQLCEFLVDRPKGEATKYIQQYPLVYSLLQFEEERTAELTKEGSKQINYVSSDHGWLRTFFVLRGRAITSVLGVWLFVVAHAVVYTCLKNEGIVNFVDLSSWETFFGIALNSTLSLLLVFRLNRAAARWWMARQFWGVIIARTRSLCSIILLHGRHDPVNRDQAIRWIIAYALTSMEFLRGRSQLSYKIFLGVLSKKDVDTLELKRHPPLYAAHEARYYITQLLRASENTPLPIAMARSNTLALAEQTLNELMDKCGGCERIKATPLPIVYVAHLRSFLVLALLLYPYVWGSKWGWSTIPITALAAYAMLGIEAAAVAVEQPFRKNHVNALNMNGFWYVFDFVPSATTVFTDHSLRNLTLYFLPCSALDCLRMSFKRCVKRPTENYI